MTEQFRRFGAFSSSVDPNQISLTVESMGKVLIGLIGWYAVSKGTDPATAQTQFQGILDLILQAIPLSFSLWHTLNGLWGAVRKVIAFYTDKMTA